MLRHISMITSTELEINTKNYISNKQFQELSVGN